MKPIMNEVQQQFPRARKIFIANKKHKEPRYISKPTLVALLIDLEKEKL